MQLPHSGNWKKLIKYCVISLYISISYQCIQYNIKRRHVSASPCLRPFFDVTTADRFDRIASWDLVSSTGNFITLLSLLGIFGFTHR
jgi:hypothetical protein